MSAVHIESTGTVPIFQNEFPTICYGAAVRCTHIAACHQLLGFSIDKDVPAVSFAKGVPSDLAFFQHLPWRFDAWPNTCITS